MHVLNPHNDLLLSSWWARTSSSSFPPPPVPHCIYYSIQCLLVGKFIGSKKSISQDLGLYWLLINVIEKKPPFCWSLIYYKKQQLNKWREEVKLLCTLSRKSIKHCYKFIMEYLLQALGKEIGFVCLSSEV